MWCIKKRRLIQYSWWSLPALIILWEESFNASNMRLTNMAIKASFAFFICFLSLWPWDRLFVFGFYCILAWNKKKGFLVLKAIIFKRCLRIVVITFNIICHIHRRPYNCRRIMSPPLPARAHYTPLNRLRDVRREKQLFTHSKKYYRKKMLFYR